MRLRNVKNASVLLEEHPEWVVPRPEEWKGKWNSLFQEPGPIHLEIVCGKGRFLTQMAKASPDIHFIGMEKFDSVIVRSLQKLLKEPLDNVRLIRADAVRLDEMFAFGEVETLYLNFSDPWPKPSHSRRRLTSPEYLARYRKLLKVGSSIHFKTDNFALFAFSMKSFVDAGMEIRRITLDLHRETDIPNIETEFEQRFVAMGKPIFYFHAILREEHAC
jgi:tRNA (guanine-N7-)-methyltransferase